MEFKKKSRLENRLVELGNENKKLVKDIEQFDAALTWHREKKNNEETSLRGILKKEIGGSMWGSGAKGKLTGLKTVKDLERNETTSDVKKPTISKRSPGALKKTKCDGLNVRMDEDLGSAKTDKPLKIKSHISNAKTENMDSEEKAQSGLKGNIERKTQIGAKKQSKDDKGLVLAGKKTAFPGHDKDEISPYAKKIATMKAKVLAKAADKWQEKLESERKNDVKKNSNPKFKKTTKAKGTENQKELDSENHKVLDHGLTCKSVFEKISSERDFENPHLASRCDSEVTSWLYSLNLKDTEKYIKLFTDHEIDMESLMLIEESQLKEMGITAVGALSKILFGLKELRGEDLEKALSSRREKDTDSTKKESRQSKTETQNFKTSNSNRIKTESKPSDKFSNQTEKPSKRPSSAKLYPSSTQNNTKKRPLSAVMGAQHKSKSIIKRSESMDKIPVEQKALSADQVTRKAANQNVKRLASTGVEAAIRKVSEQKQREEVEEKKQQKILEAKKAARDKMAAHYKAKKEGTLEPPSVKEQTTKQWGAHQRKAQHVEDVMKEVIKVDVKKKGKGVKEEIPRKHIEAPKSTSTPLKCTIGSARQEISVPATQLQMMGEETFTVTSSKHAATTSPKKSPPRKTTVNSNEFENPEEKLKELELQITGLHQKASTAGTGVTAEMIDQLQQQLNAVQQQMREQIHHQIDTEQDNRTSLASVSAKPKQSSVRASSAVGLSMSKHELLKECRKQQDDHRKQIRHLEGELSRLKHKDPLRSCELPWEDIKYNEEDLIGEGAFSQVFRGTFQGSEVAIKRLKVPLKVQDKNYFSAEVSLLRELRHPRVVLLLGVCTSSHLPLMVLELMAQGSLYTHLHDESKPPLDHVAYYQIARDTALGMNYLHKHKPVVLHLDLKSMNVLLGSHGRAKIADFGFSKLRHDAETTASKSSKTLGGARGTPAWMAPELLNSGDITIKADVYSYGIVLWEMLTRQHPYEGCSTFQVLERVRTNKRPEIPSSCPANLSLLIERCWDQNPARRPKFEDILELIDNLSFPPEWRALFSAAGIPQEAMHSVHSAREIIHLVSQTLDPDSARECEKQWNDMDLGSLSPRKNKSDDLIPSPRTFKSDDRDHLETQRSDLGQGYLKGQGQNGVNEFYLDFGESFGVDLKQKLTDSGVNQETYRHYGEDDFLYSSAGMKSMKAKTEKFKLDLSDFLDNESKSEMNPLRQTYDLENPDVLKSADADRNRSCRSENQTSRSNIHSSRSDVQSSRSNIQSSRMNVQSSRILNDTSKVQPPPPPPIPTSYELRESLAKFRTTAVSNNFDTKHSVPKSRTVQSKDSANTGVRFSIPTAELLERKQNLKPTDIPHPNQLKDLRNISEEQMNSIAEVLRKAVNDRRIAMREGPQSGANTEYTRSTIASGWSFPE